MISYDFPMKIAILPLDFLPVLPFSQAHAPCWKDIVVASTDHATWSHLVMRWSLDVKKTQFFIGKPSISMGKYRLI